MRLTYFFVFLVFFSGMSHGADIYLKDMIIKRESYLRFPASVDKNYEKDVVVNPYSVNAAKFIITGEPGEWVTIKVSQNFKMIKEENSIKVKKFIYSGITTFGDGKLDDKGVLIVRVGGIAMPKRGVEDQEYIGGLTVEADYKEGVTITEEEEKVLAEIERNTPDSKDLYNDPEINQEWIENNVEISHISQVTKMPEEKKKITTEIKINSSEDAMNALDSLMQ